MPATPEPTPNSPWTVTARDGFGKLRCREAGNDIIVEVERQLRSLRRQAGKTRKYRKLKEEFRRVQRLRLRVENDRFKADSKVLGDRLEKVRGREESVAGDLRRQETAHRDKNREREWLEAKLDQIKTRKSQTDLELDRAQNSVVHARQQIEQTQTGQQTIRSERAGLDASLETLREELQRYSSQFETLEKEKEQAARELRDALDEVKRGTERLDVSESKLEELRSRLMASTAEAASLRNLKEQLNHRIGRLEADRTRRRPDSCTGESCSPGGFHIFTLTKSLYCYCFVLFFFVM